MLFSIFLLALVSSISWEVASFSALAASAWALASACSCYLNKTEIAYTEHVFLLVNMSGEMIGLSTQEFNKSSKDWRGSFIIKGFDSFSISRITLVNKVSLFACRNNHAVYIESVDINITKFSIDLTPLE